MAGEVNTQMNSWDNYKWQKWTGQGVQPMPTYCGTSSKEIYISNLFSVKQNYLWLNRGAMKINIK